MGLQVKMFGKGRLQTLPHCLAHLLRTAGEAPFQQHERPVILIFGKGDCFRPLQVSTDLLTNFIDQLAEIRKPRRPGYACAAKEDEPPLLMGLQHVVGNIRAVRDKLHIFLSCRVKNRGFRQQNYAVSYFCWEAFPVLSMRTSNVFREELRSELTVYLSLYPIKEYCFFIFNLYWFVVK